MSKINISKITTTDLKNSSTSILTIDYFYNGQKFNRTIVRDYYDETSLKKILLAYHESFQELEA